MRQPIVKLAAAAILMIATSLLPQRAQSSNCCTNCQNRLSSCNAYCESSYESCARGCRGCPFCAIEGAGCGPGACTLRLISCRAVRNSVLKGRASPGSNSQEDLEAARLVDAEEVLRELQTL